MNSKEECIAWLEPFLKASEKNSSINGGMGSVAEGFVRSILSHLRASERWQPIETAPRDGRIILGWSAGWESSTAIQWVKGYTWVRSDGEVVVESDDWDWNGTISCPPSHDPTHWQPLPPAPYEATP